MLNPTVQLYGNPTSHQGPSPSLSRQALLQFYLRSLPKFESLPGIADPGNATIKSTANPTFGRRIPTDLGASLTGFTGRRPSIPTFDPSTAVPRFTGGSGRVSLANEIMALHKSGRINLRGNQVSGVSDSASSLHTILQAAQGRASHTSGYGHAGGRATHLDGRMLEGMRSLAEKYTFSVSSITGGKHGKHSRHYAGHAFDVSSINGRRVNSSHPDVKNFMRDAKKLGATEVLGPGARGHSGHVHLGWSRSSDETRAYSQSELQEKGKTVQTAARESDDKGSPRNSESTEQDSDKQESDSPSDSSGPSGDDT